MMLAQEDKMKKQKAAITEQKKRSRSPFVFSSEKASSSRDWTISGLFILKSKE